MSHVAKLVAVFAFVCSLPNVPAAAAQEPSEPFGPDRVNALIAQAKSKGLALKRQWLRLGHWQDTVFVGLESQADGEEFFLAKNGKSNPAAELEATIRSFFSVEPADNSAPVCKFPARLLWLSTQLAFDPGPMLVPCTGFSEFVDGLRPKSLVLVFSSYYLRKAASAFGHTFFRIERNEPVAVTEKRQLLDAGIDYSATVTVGNPVLYAVLGFTGGFRGSFRKMPYYYKVREYNDFESRDLWEYNLNLTPQELAMFVAHLWELGHTYFKYFYLSENCGFHILSALEAASPRIELLKHLKTPTLPGDTIKALFENPGLVGKIDYRPSLNSQFQARLKQLDGAQRTELDSLIENPEHELPSSMSEEDRIEVFDSSVDLIDLRWARELLTDTASKPARAKRRILERRSQILKPSKTLVVAPPWDKMPQRAHGSRRFGLAGGYHSDNGSLGTAELRIGMHDLADPADGYPEFSSIEFIRLKLAYSFRGAFKDPGLSIDRLSVEEFSLVSITNLIPISRFTRGTSWSVDVGGGRVADSGCDQCFVGRVRVGGGGSFSLGGDRLIAFGMISGLVASGPSLDGIEGKPIRLGFGPKAGLRLRLSSRVLAVGSARWLWLPTQEPFSSWEARAHFRWLATDSIAFDVSAADKQGAFEAILSTFYYH